MDALFATASVAVMPVYALMLCAPRARLARSRPGCASAALTRYTQTRALLRSSSPLWLLIAAVHALALAQSWQSDTLALMFRSASDTLGLPALENIQRMFARPDAAAASWVHLLGLDLLVARHVHSDALRRRLPAAHSLVLCMMFGPTGLLCHAATRALVQRLRAAQAAAGGVERAVP